MKPEFKEGDDIKGGQIIGYIGGSGYGKEFGQAVHLHYELHQYDEEAKRFRPINPVNENGELIDPQKDLLGLGSNSNNGSTSEKRSNTFSEKLQRFNSKLERWNARLEQRLKGKGANKLE